MKIFPLAFNTNVFLSDDCLIHMKKLVMDGESTSLRYSKF